MSVLLSLLNNLNFQGFYAVYKEVFRVIAEEDYTFMDDKEEDNEHPEFGDSQSSYEEVSQQFAIFVNSAYCVVRFCYHFGTCCP